MVSIIALRLVIPASRSMKLSVAYIRRDVAGVVGLPERQKTQTDIAAGVLGWPANKHARQFSTRAIGKFSIGSTVANAAMLDYVLPLMAQSSGGDPFPL